MVDLHTHSLYSDGTCTPAELVARAQRAGLKALALCDHNTVEGLEAFVAAGQDSGLEAVPGVELSTQYQGRELHILALFVQPAHYGPVTALLEDFRRRKEQSNLALTQALSQRGMAIDYPRLRREAEGYVNRAVIGAELTRLGYTASVQEAFQKYLGEAAGLYQPPQRPDALQSVAFLRRLGVVSVLAHPFLNLEVSQLRQFLDAALPLGLDAMEVRYSEYDPGTQALSEQLARDYGLLPSGGSDYHAENKPHIRLGTGRGDLAVPESYFLALKERYEERKHCQ